MGEVLFLVEQESATGQWCIKRDASVRASYASRAQAVVDARQLARFECELRDRSAIVRVIDAERRVTEDLVCTPTAPRRATIRPGGARFLIR
jgi:hypothetical protein